MSKDKKKISQHDKTMRLLVPTGAPTPRKPTLAARASKEDYHYVEAFHEYSLMNLFFFGMFCNYVSKLLGKWGRFD